MRILVTGGAGYVGSVSVERFIAARHEVVVLDSLVTGHRGAVDPRATFVEGDIKDASFVARVLRDHGVEAVLHCAARALVPESVVNPGLYYRENVGGGVALLEGMVEAGVDRIVFSSTCAVYGQPDATPITEETPQRPINPYGSSKLAFEGALGWFGKAHGIRAFALRYFNVAGASEDHGEVHDPETHLIPNVLGAVDGGKAVVIMGTDYPTPDGTCVRDYIHVEDLADAHLAALEHTASGQPGLQACNLGSGSGFTVWQVVRTAERVVGRPVPHEVGPRRPGDPPVLVATNELARTVLGWIPRRGSLDEMIGSAWAWRQKHPNGYAG